MSEQHPFCCVSIYFSLPMTELSWHIHDCIAQHIIVASILTIKLSLVFRAMSHSSEKQCHMQCAEFPLCPWFSMQCLYPNSHAHTKGNFLILSPSGTNKTQRDYVVSDNDIRCLYRTTMLVVFITDRHNKDIPIESICLKRSWSWYWPICMKLV